MCALVLLPANRPMPNVNANAIPSAHFVIRLRMVFCLSLRCSLRFDIPKEGWAGETYHRLWA